MFNAFRTLYAKFRVMLKFMLAENHAKIKRKKDAKTKVRECIDHTL